jgi:hypothetical protein
MNNHEHDYVYGGVKYKVGSYKLPGSGAYRVTYYDWFYCRECLENEYKRLQAESNTYEKIRFDARPMQD